MMYKKSLFRLALFCALLSKVPLTLSASENYTEVQETLPTKGTSKASTLVKMAIVGTTTLFILVTGGITIKKYGFPTKNSSNDDELSKVNKEKENVIEVPPIDINKDDINRSENETDMPSSDKELESTKEVDSEEEALFTPIHNQEEEQPNNEIKEPSKLEVTDSSLNEKEVPLLKKEDDIPTEEKPEGNYDNQDKNPVSITKDTKPKKIKKKSKFEDWLLGIDKNKVVLLNPKTDKSIEFEQDHKNTKIQDIKLKALDPQTGQVAIVTYEDMQPDNIWILNFEKKRLEKLSIADRPLVIKHIAYHPTKSHTLMVVGNNEIFSIPTHTTDTEQIKTIYIKKPYCDFCSTFGCDKEYIYYSRWHTEKTENKDSENSSGPQADSKSDLPVKTNLASHSVKKVYSKAMDPLDSEEKEISLHDIQDKIKSIDESQTYELMCPQISPNGKYIACLFQPRKKPKENAEDIDNVERKSFLYIMHRGENNTWELLEDNDWKPKIFEDYIYVYNVSDEVLGNKASFKFNVNPTVPKNLSLVVQLTSKKKNTPVKEEEEEAYFDTTCIIPLTNKEDREVKTISLPNNIRRSKVFISSDETNMIYSTWNNLKRAIYSESLGNNSEIETKELPKLKSLDIDDVHGLIPISEKNSKAAFATSN